MGDLVSRDLKENIEKLKYIFKDTGDIIFRSIDIGRDYKRGACLVYTDGLVNAPSISEHVIQTLFRLDKCDDFDIRYIKSNIMDLLAKEAIAIPEVKEEDDLDKIVDAILSGQTALFIDGADKVLILETRGWPNRGVNQPDSETVVRGPRDGFTETLKINMTLIRRRIKDPKLKTVLTTVGRRSKTDVAIMYIEDIVSPEILEEVNKRLNQIDIDAILDSSMLEFLIEDNYLSPFPQIESTERPDSVAASLCEGRVGILVDNSPFALVVPATVGTLTQTSEDYYSRWTIASVVRFIRLISIFISSLAPALYIAITSFHPGIIPTRLNYYLGASRINVPFPAVVEAFLMEATLELLRESGSRIAGPIGTTIGIVGGLIIGQAAVEAGIVSPLMIIVVAITTIATFSIPKYEWASGFRFIRFIFMILASILGLYGIILGVAVTLTHLSRMESFGIPFTAPYSGLGIKEGDLKDTLVKAPIQKFEYRPAFTFPRNRRRMRKR